MTLTEDPVGEAIAAEWVGKFFMLGRLLVRWSLEHADGQLVVVLSVPVRDFAAVLIGCGWITARAGPRIPRVREVLADLPLHAPVHVVTPSKVLIERFGGVNVEKDRAKFGTEWQICRCFSAGAMSASRLCVDVMPCEGVLGSLHELGRHVRAGSRRVPIFSTSVSRTFWLTSSMSARSSR